MKTWKALVVLLSGIVLFQAGWIAGQMLPWAAHAEEPEALVMETPPYPGNLKCKLFDVPLDHQVEVTDKTTEIGQWVGDHEAEWQVFSADFEAAQKATGYPAGLLYVCLYPR